MWLPLVLLVVALSLGVAGWAGWRALRDRPVILRQLWASAVVEGALLLQALVAAVRAGGAAGPPEALIFWGYVATSLCILPFAALWAFAERSRWSSVVLLVAAFTVAFLQYRLLQLWPA